MSAKVSCGLLIAALCLAGCGSDKSESEQEGEHADSPAAQLVRHFYEAANDANGTEACGLLTEAGIRTVVRVKTRDECIRTVDGFEAGSFESDEGELVEIEEVDEDEDGFDVDAVVKGRTEGAYSVVRRGGRLLIDGFKSEEG
jgi:hypothetical protein